MDHLDLAGVLTTPPQWNLPVFEQQDALFLSSSRQMLEPIMEETSEDEECAMNSWHQYDQSASDAEGNVTEGDSTCGASISNGGNSFWSSAESDTGSVIRIEVTKDNDSHSERDFLCPAKRARRCDDAINEEEVILRRPVGYGSDLKNNSLERFLNYENFSRDSWGNQSQQRSSLGSTRRGGYDDFYSDSDSLSYNSLSRSSSLIQFESLERQLLMQEQHASMTSLGNSSPSLLSFDMQNQEDLQAKNSNHSANNSGNNSRRGSQSSLLKKYESLDGRLHQTYYDLDKLNFDDMQVVHSASADSFSRNCTMKINSHHLAELRSDSEGSSSESSELNSRPRSVLSKEENTDKFNRLNSLQSKKGKSSAENLSEDSGYCEPAMAFGLRRTKSQTLIKNYEKFSEEEEEMMENKSLNYKDNLNEFKNIGTLEQQQNSHSNSGNIKSPPLSPQLEFIRHKQRHETHSPSPVSSEVSTSSSQNSRTSCSSSASSSSSSSASTASTASSSSSSSSSSASSTSSATTCASKASFTWLITSTTNNCTTASPLNRSPSSCVVDDGDDEEEVPSPRACLAEPTQISINDLRLAETTSEENVQHFGGNLNRNINGGECLECKNLLNENFYAEQQASSSLLKTCRKCGENICGSFFKCQKCKENNFKNKNQYPLDIEQQQQIIEKENCPNCGEYISENKTLYEFSERVRKKLQILSDAHSGGSGGGEFPLDSLKRNKLCDNFKDFENSETNSLKDYSSCGATPKTKHFNYVCKANAEDSLPFKGLQRYQLYSLMPSWPLKTCSVPNDLNTIGRKKKTKKPQHNYSSTYNQDLLHVDQNPDNEAVIAQEDLFSESLNIKKSSSWHGLNSSKHKLVGKTEDNNKNLGLLHRSYYNLSALTKEETERMAEKRLSSDYETEIVCKNNFLLDELSAHFDRTASILNDKPMDEEDVTQNVTLNLSNSSSTEEEEAEPETEAKEHVQHVQLVIRQPPARQKRNKDNEKANSLTQDFTFNAIMQCGQAGVGKTFDQDPTILKTSYAQSLEKCNFDCKELSSTQDLQRARTMPKRRFQSQASANKKKSLVSSTPNLNAFEQEDIEDDLFVSSAHTSMHQLPLSQTQKPLGILLPVGSRTSFGKEVSFCPVVSKYCWQEQSSEECNEGSQELLNREEESEDELLDNADATVIYNTKENENIAAKFNEESLKREQQPNKSNNGNEMIANLGKETNENGSSQESTTEEQKNLSTVPKQQNDNETLVKESEQKQAEGEQMVFEETQQSSGELLSATLNTVSLATNVNNETLKVDAQNNNNKNDKNLSENKRDNNINKPTVVVARPLSIQLPILSEPPINRAHHILYASQQMLDNFQKQQEHEQYEHFKSQSTYNLTSTQQQQQQQQKMASNNSLSAELQTTSNNKLNNNNEVLKTKFKHEEKHPNSKGFLSRFANGFRFSLRRNKKKLQQQQQQQQQKENQLTDDSLTSQAKSKSLPNNIKQQQDFIHIPLKGPLNKQQQQQQHNGNTQQTNGNALNKKQKGAKISSTGSGSSSSSTTTMNTNDKQQPQKVTGKPPIPPTMQKLQSAQSSQQQTQTQQPLVEVGLSRFYTETNNTTTSNGVYNPRSSTQDFLNSERFYNQQQEQQQQQQQSCNNHTLTLNTNEENVEINHSLNSSTNNNNNNQENSFSVTTPTTTMTAVNTHNNNTNNNSNYDFSSSPSRASVSQKTQMFNNLSRQTCNNTQPKIGLIETNLDTHETIITGKTRSLINIAPQQQQLRSAGNKRHHNNIITNVHHHHHHHHLHQQNADDEGYDDNDDDEVIVRPDGTVVVIKNAGSNDNSSPASQAAQIASVRRPHKSMEFLLDKENQKDVMNTSENVETDLNAQDAVQPLRKRKLRRSLSLRRNNSMLETATQGATSITTTDSDSDAKAEKSQTQQQQPQSCTLPKSSKCGNYVKKLIFKTLHNSPSQDQQQNVTICSNELSIVELDGSWMRKVNSPSKIKNAYTLTVISSPSPATGSGSSDDDLPTQKSSRSWPSLTEAEIINKDKRSKDENDNTTQETMECKFAQEKLKQLMENFIDQGFETGSNDMESPLKLNRKPSNPQNYSTPNATKSLQQNFNANDSILSPIRHNNSRRQPSNLNMTVIQEHNSTEGLEKLNESATFLIEQQTATYTLPNCSQFWVTCGEFTAALAIQYYEAEHLMLLSNIFAQKVSQDHAIDFGIDKQTFSWNGTAKLDDVLLEGVPSVENCSQYWFATGNTLIPFSGKQMSPEKISNFFNYIRSFMSDTKSSLKFGIDGYEFSISQEHNLLQHLNLNSMFNGLNSLATPASPIKTSDLDASDFDSGEFDPSLTFSALNGQQCDLVSLEIQPECSSLDCMEQILSDAKLLNLSKSETDKLAMEAHLTVPDMLRTLQNQKCKLETLEDRMQHCSSTLDMQKFTDLNQNSPELMRKLRSTITAIENIGHNCSFNQCTLQQLESFMFFLSRYADLCLASCTHHIEQIMEVVLTQRTTLPVQN